MHGYMHPPKEILTYTHVSTYEERNGSERSEVG